MIEIKSENLTAKISKIGAELKSLKLASGKEIMFQGHEEFDFSSPLLFPIVGKLKDDQFTYKGKKYTMEIHGFLRYCDFKLKEQGENYAILFFGSNAETLKQYPFEFSFEIEYKIIGKEIYISYEITSLSSEMYFSFGFHPAFNCVYNGKSISFSQKENVEVLKLEKGIIQRKSTKMMIDGKIDFGLDTFSNKAIIFKDLSSKNVTLNCDYCSVEMDISNYPYFALWSNKENFVCLEPWLSTADNEDVSGDITKKPDIKKLEKNEVYKNNLKISIGG